MCNISFAIGGNIHRFQGLGIGCVLMVIIQPNTLLLANITHANITKGAPYLAWEGRSPEEVADPSAEILNSGWEWVSMSLPPSSVWLGFSTILFLALLPILETKSAANPLLALLTPSSLPHICQPLPWGWHLPLHGWLQLPSPDLPTPERQSYVHTCCWAAVCESPLPSSCHPSSTPTSPSASIVLFYPIFSLRCLYIYM